MQPTGIRARYFGVLCVFAALLTFAAAGCKPAQSADDVKLANAEYELGNDAFQRGQYREALSHVQKARELDDSNADAAYLGAIVMLVFCANDETSPDCRYEDAEGYARAALVASSEMRDAKNTLGVILVHRKKAADAVKVLEPLANDILYRSPEKAWGNLGWAYLEAGQPNKAIEALKRAIAAQPSFCVGHYRLGLAYEKKKEYAAARQAFTRALGIEEGGCGRLQAALLGRARVLLRLGQLAEVRKDLKRCQDLASSSPIGKTCGNKLAKLP